MTKKHRNHAPQLSSRGPIYRVEAIISPACLCEGRQPRSNLVVKARDCHAEFTLSGGEILRPDKSGLRMIKAKGSQ